MTTQQEIRFEDLSKATMFARYQLVDRKELASLLGVSEVQVKKLTLAGKLPVIKIGSSCRYNITEVFDVLMNQ